MRTFSAIALAVGLITNLSSARAAPVEERDASLVLTPAGYRPADKAFQAPSGALIEVVGEELHVTHNGEIIHKAKYDTSKTVPNTVKPAFSGSGWIAWTGWTQSNPTSDPISTYTTDWAVPANPTASDGQTVFLFNGLMPAGGGTIIQPVLQWGPSQAGGGNYWAVASWYVDNSNNTIYTKPVQVNIAQALTGKLSLTSVSGSSYTYDSVFNNIAGTSLSHTGGVFSWATETLEVYKVVSTSDLPAGSTVFSNINIRLKSGATPSLKWSVTSDNADGVTATVNTDGATNGKVTIKY